MDLKKIKVTDGLEFLDKQVEKLPDKITEPLKKFALLLLIIGGLYAIYWGYEKGAGLAVQEGQDLASDTKMLFFQEIERSYNKKKGSVRTPSSQELIADDRFKAQKEYIVPNSNSIPKEKDVVEPPSDLQNRDKEMRPNQASSEGTIVDPKSVNPDFRPTRRDNKPPLKDRFDTNETNENLDEFYSKKLSESVGKGKILERKEEKPLPVSTEDPGILKNESPKSLKKKKMINPNTGLNPNNEKLLPIEN